MINIASTTRHVGQGRRNHWKRRLPSLFRDGFSDVTKRAGLEDGVVLNMTMNGDGIYQCVYTVPSFVGPSRQEFPLQVDTGSSDMWIASTSCKSNPECTSYSGPRYDPSSATSTGANLDIAYHRGRVQGPIVIDTVEIGGYVVQKQAFSAASDITSEDLSTGSGFSGLIGLSLPANSIVADELQQSNADGQIFTSHLFNSTSPSPSQKFFSLLLERPHFPNIASYLGIGAHPPLPSPHTPKDIVYSPIIGTDPGPLFWRVPLTRITIHVDGQALFVPLSSGSQAQGVSSIWPVALLDSGGSGMITTRDIANGVYGAWGIGPGRDDKMYYVPCNLVMNVTFLLGAGVSIEVPIHPLDMSHEIPTEPGSATCLGALQAEDNPIPAGDLILGASFMRNIYTVLSYQTYPPQLGILPITDPVAALNEFNTIRIQKQPLGSGLSPSEQITNSTTSASSQNDSKGGSSKVGLYALAGVGVFIVLAAIGIWFGLRKLRERNRLAAERGTPLEGSEMVTEMKSAKMKTVDVHGVQGDEAFNMFGTGSDGAAGSAHDGVSGSTPRWQPAGELGERYPRPRGRATVVSSDGDSMLMPGDDPFRKADTRSTVLPSMHSATSLTPSESEERPVAPAPSVLDGNPSVKER